MGRLGAVRSAVRFVPPTLTAIRVLTGDPKSPVPMVRIARTANAVLAHVNRNASRALCGAKVIAFKPAETLTPMSALNGVQASTVVTITAASGVRASIWKIVPTCAPKVRPPVRMATASRFHVDNLMATNALSLAMPFDALRMKSATMDYV